MEQISRFDINGTIGTKITVSVSHDSKTDIPLANRLMLRYKGEEDDILKSIEAGNTTLSLPNTQFVGYSQSIRGLFGIKTMAQVGNLNLTAIASQEKGNSERTSIEAGASASKSYVRDYSYASGRIFDLGKVDSAIFGLQNLDFYSGDSISFIEVYIRSGGYEGANEAAPEAKFWVHPEDTALFDNESSLTTVDRVDPEDFLVQPVEHWILFNRANAGSQKEIGVYMIVNRNDGSVDTIGNISEEPYQLKLLKQENPDSTQQTWHYEWRNVYALGGANIDLSGLEINVYEGTVDTEKTDENLDHQEGIQFIRILGLDRYNQSGSVGPDGLVDVETPIVDPYRGLLIFPDRTPFDSEIEFVEGIPLEKRVSEIYKFSINSQQVIQASNYYLEISNRSRGANISLGKPNIIEGSERITLNGRELVKGQDYNINYDFGQVTFITDEALDPNANLNIDFEYSPFITAQKKTLFGVRGEYSLSDNLKFGSTFLYKSDKATDRKPKVGQETAKTVIWDGDLSFKVEPQFLTSMVNALPFYATEVKSNLQVSAEVAQSHPNPNVDGEAYIDDFEGSRDSYTLGVFREAWTMSSVPATFDSTRHRGKMIWYNPYTQVATSQIWNRELRPGEGGTHTLWVEFDPVDTVRVVDTLGNVSYNEVDPVNSWTGVTRYMTAGTVNQDRAQLLELRVLGDRGIIHVDLGEISEDVNGNDVLDTEDRKSEYGFANGIIDAGEDTGMDGLMDEEEPGYDPVSNPDPNGDNWYYNGFGKGCDGCGTDDYSHINGTEGNENDPNRLGRPDTEDIDRDKGIDNKNNYFSFKIDLAVDTFLVDSSEYNGWRTFRIPVRDPYSLDTAVGNPQWSQISYVRFWFESPDGSPFALAIAAADLVQSIWEDSLITISPTSQSKFSVATISNQDNTDYTPPPGVTGYYDKTNEVTEPEQSLLLQYEDLRVGDTCLAKKILFGTPSYVGYRRLKMFVHGPPSTVSDSILYFFRLGSGEEDYYEYRTLLRPGWDDSNEVDIDFNEITLLKEFLLRARTDNPDTNIILSEDGTYLVFGNPTLTRVKYLASGIINASQDTTYSWPSGAVWLDELRLSDVRQDVGMAYRASVNGNLADLFSYSFNYNYKNSFFRGISSSTRGGSQTNLGSGKTTNSYRGSINFKFDKLLPRSLGASIPISLSYSKSTDIPLLRFGTDVILSKELQESEKNVNISKSLSVSESFNKKTRNPIFTLLLNRIRTNLSYSRSEGRSPKTPSSLTENYRFGSNYSFRIKNVPTAKIFFWTKPIPLLKKMGENRLFLFPESFNMTGNFNRNLSISENSSGIINQSLRRTFDGNMKVGYRISDNLTSNYSMSTKRDLQDPETIKITTNPKTFKFGRETAYSQSFGVGYNPKLFGFIYHNLTFTAGYREGINVRDSTRNADASRSYGVGGNLDLKRLFGTGSKSKSGDRFRRRDDSTVNVVVAEPKKSVAKKLSEPFVGVLRLLTGWINPINYEFNERYSYSYTGLLERAWWRFRFGVTDKLGARLNPSASGNTRSTAVVKSNSISLRSGASFLGGIRADVTYSRKLSEDIVKVTNPQKSIGTTFPDIKFNIQQLKVFKFLNPFIRKFSPRTGYTKSKNETENIQTGVKVMEKTTVGRRPLLALNLNVIKGVTINFNTDRSVTTSKSFNSQSGDVQSQSRSTQKTTSLSAKYSFSSPNGIKIPLFGRIRFRSTLSLSTDISMRKQITENALADGPFGKTDERNDLAITPVISYSFSNQIKGGLSAKWQTSNNLQTKKKSNTRELRIWVEIRF
jgi:cell surface protein SprA